MISQNKMVAMLLAGGQGSRLKALTKNTAKPAVPFGGKYKIIDFGISNAANSGIDNIGILTQYKPFYLNEHIGLGAAWDFDKYTGGLKLLSPYYSEDGGRWYKGTANAIYENIDYLDQLNPSYVLILSGDHIYKMNYEKMLNAHKKKEAQVSIAVMEVPWEDASRFGIMNTDDEDRIIEFDEKPAEPKSNLASMGIYIFDWPVLREALIEDYKDKDSEYDFGKNIIPKLLEAETPIYAYRFSGYWKDVGTVRSYWEANLDLIDENNSLDIYDKDWRINTSAKNLPPHFITPTGKVSNVLINEACCIAGSAKDSVLFDRVTIEEGAYVEKCVLLPGTTVRKGAELYNCVVSEGIEITGDQKIGEKDDTNVYLISSNGVEKE